MPGGGGAPKRNGVGNQFFYLHKGWVKKIRVALKGWVK
jgi:hypothetical protein